MTNAQSKKTEHDMMIARRRKTHKRKMIYVLDHIHL